MSEKGEKVRRPGWDAPAILWLIYWIFTGLVLIYVILQILVYEMEGPGGPVCILILMLLVIPGGCGYLYWRGFRKRTLQLANVSEEMDLRFIPKVPDETMRFLPRFMLFKKSKHNKARNGISGERDGVEFLILDFEYAYTVAITVGHADEMGYPIDQTILIFPNPERALPDFSLMPRGGILDSFVGVLFGKDKGLDIDVGESPAFEKNYLVHGADERLLRKVLGPAVRGFFAEEPGWCVESCEGRLLIYRPGKKLNPDAVPTRIDKAFRIRKLLLKGCAGKT